jgi:hypothetical protein
MPSWEAWEERDWSNEKRGRGEAQALKVRLQNCFKKSENVS